MNKRIETLSERIGYQSSGGQPALVFVDKMDDVFKVMEDYFKYDAGGQIVRGSARRKEFTTGDSLDTILKRYNPPTIVFHGEVEQ